MTTKLLPPKVTSLSTTELFPVTSQSVVSPANPSESAREEMLFNKLGTHGWGRLHHFRTYYSQGWGDLGRGHPLSPRSLEAFFRFLEIMPVPRNGRPRIFLTDSGHLELCWQDQAGKAVQLEFTPDVTEFYIEATEAENSIPHASISDLIKILPLP